MKKIAFDTETKGLDWHKPNENGAFLATWADADKEYKADLSKPDEAERFVDALRNATTIIAHNLPFDVHQVRETLGFDILEWAAENGTQLHDTDIMARIAIPAGQSRPSYKLKDLGQTYIRSDAKEGDDEIKKIAKQMKLKMSFPDPTPQAYYLIWRAYPEIMEKYALLDARLTYDLHEFLLSDDPRVKFSLTDSGIWDMEKQVQPILIQAEARGVALDQKVVKQLESEYRELMEQHRETLLKELPPEALGGEGSEDALIQAFLDMGVPLEVRTEKSGKFSTAAWVLEPFEKDYPIITAWLGFEKARKFLSTFIEPMVDEPVVHTNFGQYEAWTGRMSSWRPNLQNLPTRAPTDVPIRSMFVPRPGHSFLVYDYDSIEIRIYAHYANDQDFRDDITNGRDINAMMAWMLADDGRTEDEFKKGTDGESERALAKRTTYGTLYGLGGRGLTQKEPDRFDPGPFYGPDHPEIKRARATGRFWPKEGYQYQEARDFLARVKKALPGYHSLNRKIKQRVESRGWIHTLYGRKQLVSKDKSYVGMNALIQGTAADLMKLGVIKVHEAIQPYGGILLLVVHDEVVVEVPTEHAEACSEAVKAAMKAATDKLDPALEVSGSVVETNYADAK